MEHQPVRMALGLADAERYDALVLGALECGASDVSRSAASTRHAFATVFCHMGKNRQAFEQALFHIRRKKNGFRYVWIILKNHWLAEKNMQSQTLV